MHHDVHQLHQLQFLFNEVNPQGEVESELRFLVNIHLSEELGLKVLDLEVEVGQGMPLQSMMLVQVKMKVNPFLLEMHQMIQLEIKCVQFVEAYDQAKKLQGG